MAVPTFDVFKKDRSGEPVWLETTTDLEAAADRLKQLANTSPGEYFVFSQYNQQIVAIEGSKSSIPSARQTSLSWR
jgi:hypothetical protein